MSDCDSRQSDELLKNKKKCGVFFKIGVNLVKFQMLNIEKEKN